MDKTDRKPARRPYQAPRLILVSQELSESGPSNSYVEGGDNGLGGTCPNTPVYHVPS